MPGVSSGLNSGLAMGISGPRSRPFSPARLSGLALWLDPSQGITLNSGAVSQWDDKSGNGNDAAQATAANQPLYKTAPDGINSAPALLFDGANDNLAVPANAPLADQFAGGGTRIFVYQGAGNGGTQVVRSGGGSDIIMRGAASAESLGFRSFRATTNGDWRVNIFDAGGAPNIIVITYDSDNVANDPAVRVNGVDTAIIGVTAPVGAALADNGNRLLGAASLSFAGRLGCNLEYDRILLVSEIAQVERYLANIYGISI